MTDELFIIAFSLFVGCIIFWFIVINKKLETLEEMAKDLKKYEFLFKTLDKHAWKIEHIYDYSLKTFVRADSMQDRVIAIDVVSKEIHDHLIDDRKSTCKNCIHSDVCSNQWLMHPDTEMKDICKNFEMKPKEK